jgi:hypothetical protein
MIDQSHRSTAVAAIFVLSVATSVSAQQVTVGTPFVSVGDSFVESFGLGFSFGFPGRGFTGGGVSSDIGSSRIVGFNPFPVAWPAGGFGAFDPGAGASFGWGIRGDGLSGGFNLAAAQGSSRNLSATAGSLTVTNGVPGFFAATTQRPFVTGLIPVVGDYGGGIAPVFGPAALMPMPTNRSSVVRERINRLKAGERPATLRPPIPGDAPADHNRADVASDEVDGFRARLRSAQGSSAGRSDTSVAEIRRQQAAALQAAADELAELRRKVAAAEVAGKPHVARIYQQQIDRRSTNEPVTGKR